MLLAEQRINTAKYDFFCNPCLTKMVNKLIEEPSSRKARAERVRYLREDVLDLSRAKMAKRFDGIFEGTLQTWEYGHHGGLTEKGAKLLTQAAESMGIKCSIEWLLYGIGEKPAPLLNQKLKDPIKERKSENQAIIEELCLLREIYPTVVDTIVSDDGMAPCFLPGDYVAGERFFGNELSKAIGKACIIQTQTGASLIRLLKEGNPEKGYMISCINPHTSVQDPILEGVPLFSAAPVFWMRRKNNKAKP